MSWVPKHLGRRFGSNMYHGPSERTFLRGELVDLVQHSYPGSTTLIVPSPP